MVETRLDTNLVEIILDAIIDNAETSKEKEKHYRLYNRIELNKGYFFFSDLDNVEKLFLVKIIRRYYNQCRLAISFEDVTDTRSYKLIRLKALNKYTEQVGNLHNFFEKNYPDFY